MQKASRILLFILGIATGILAAPVAADPQHENGADPSIEGLWVSKVVVSSDPPVVIYSLNTFFAGGQAIEDTATPTIRSVGQGEWTQVGSRQFVRTMYIFQFAAPHTFTGITKVVNHFVLNHVGDEFDAVGNFETYDTAGNLVQQGQRTSHGKRCTILTTVPQCMGLVE
jgi:hypothetical protein